MNKQELKQLIREELQKLNEVKIPARIKSKDDIKNYFFGYDGKQVEEMWNKANTTMVATAKDGKKYWVTVKPVKNGWGSYLHVKKAKVNKDGNAVWN